MNHASAKRMPELLVRILLLQNTYHKYGTIVAVANLMPSANLMPTKKSCHNIEYHKNNIITICIIRANSIFTVTGLQEPCQGFFSQGRYTFSVSRNCPAIMSEMCSNCEEINTLLSIISDVMEYMEAYMNRYKNPLGADVTDKIQLTYRDKIIDALCIHTELHREFLKKQSYSQLIDIKNTLPECIKKYI